MLIEGQPTNEELKSALSADIEAGLIGGNMEIPEDRKPAEGMIWECRACGRRAEDKYGFIGWHSPGWDESCMLNAHQTKDLRAGISPVS